MAGLISMEDMINRKTLYVSNIDRHATKSEVKIDLQVLCPRDLGVVVVPVDQVDTSTVGVAYCNFKLPSDAKDAFTRYRFGIRVCGKPVSLAYSVGKDRSRILGPWGNRLTIIIKNLSPEVTEKMLCTKFEQFGEIFRCKVDYDAAGCKYGMAQFTKESSTIRAVERADNKTWCSTVIKVERHARTRLPQGDLSAGIAPPGVVDSPIPVAPSIEPAAPSASLTEPNPPVDYWSSDSASWPPRRGLPPPPPPPPRPQITPSSSQSSAQQVTINGTDLHSFQLMDDDGDGIIIEESSASSSTTERPLQAPPMGIIGLMTEQRKLYTKESVGGPGVVAGEGDIIVENSEIENGLMPDVCNSRTHSVTQSSDTAGYMHRARKAVILDEPVRGGMSTGSIEDQSLEHTNTQMTLRDAMLHMSKMEDAIRTVIGPLERVTGSIQGEGLLCCPITQELFVDPVLAADGHTYERSAIEEWLQRSKTSPNTNLELIHPNVTPNMLVRKIVEELHLK